MKHQQQNSSRVVFVRMILLGKVTIKQSEKIRTFTGTETYWKHFTEASSVMTTKSTKVSTGYVVSMSMSGKATI